jgi:hypothetical protein
MSDAAKKILGRPWGRDCSKRYLSATYYTFSFGGTEHVLSMATRFDMVLKQAQVRENSFLSIKLTMLLLQGTVPKHEQVTVVPIHAATPGRTTFVLATSRHTGYRLSLQTEK